MSDKATPKLALSVREAAEALGISERLLRSLTQQGKVPHVRLGPSEQSRLVYPVEVLQEWLWRASGMDAENKEEEAVR